MKCPLSQKDCDIECAWLITFGISKICSIPAHTSAIANNANVSACFVNDVPVDHAGNPVERDA